MSGCSDGSLSLILNIVKNILNIIQILGPILCIISLVITFIKLMSNPDDKKLVSKIKNSIIALILLFFIPLLVNVSVGLAGDSTDFSKCWNSNRSYSNTANYVDIDGNKKSKLISDPSDYQKGEKKTTNNSSGNNNSKSNSNNNNSNNENSNSSDTSNTGSLIKKEETNTLKVYIYKSGSYYITKLWVKNPYSQLNKYDSPSYGSSLYRPSKLLERAISSNNLSNKLIVGFNASGFYLKDVYDSASVKSYPAYDKTSVGSLVITNGKVVRNAYNHAVKTWYIAGVDKSNNLRIFEDNKSSDANSKKQWANSVIGTIRNTFTFASPLVINGKASNITTSMPSPSSSKNRQAICQIDSNNFMLITGADLNRSKLINIMLKEGCNTGTNFDGGGSIALLFKSGSSNNIETITGNRRSLSEVGYFSE